ncbi:PTS sugar transporter subunit IIA [Vibrio lentus]|nr:PTS sugar transporter subunit IIA [Vibrio lentus]
MRTTESVIKKPSWQTSKFAESQSITSMDGIAYPHSKSKAVTEPAIAVGVKREGIESMAMKTASIQPYFFMIASPDNGC